MRSVQPVQEIEQPPEYLGSQAGVTIFHGSMMARGKILI